MSIIGHTPESGVRIDVIRPREGGPPWRYEGEAVTPRGRLALSATVSAEGEVVVEFGVPGDDAPSSAVTAERVRLLVRAAYKHARSEGGEGQPPPRRILRWRPDADVAPPGRDE